MWEKFGRKNINGNIWGNIERKIRRLKLRKNLLINLGTNVEEIFNYLRMRRLEPKYPWMLLFCQIQCYFRIDFNILNILSIFLTYILFYLDIFPESHYFFNTALNVQIFTLCAWYHWSSLMIRVTSIKSTNLKRSPDWSTLWGWLKKAVDGSKD